MSKKKIFNFERLIAESENLLNDFKTIDNFGKNSFESDKDAISEQIQSSEMAAIERSLGLPTDGYVDIEVSSDYMICTACFYPPFSGGGHIKQEDVEKLLNEKNIMINIDWDKISELLLHCNIDYKFYSEIPIALGVNPSDEIPRHIVISKEILKSFKPENNKNKVNYKEISPFIMVKKGDTLARIIPEVEGIPGKNLKGEMIPFKKKNVKMIHPKKNTEIIDNRIVAAIDGKFEMSGDYFSVNKTLLINGNVDYSTGHVEFDGDVVINGIVKDGFHIKSGGSVFCNKTLDASEVSCAKDLIIEQGIIGRKKGRIRVLGEIKAKFVENCYIQARGSIFVESSLLSSSINTNNKLTMGKRGIIVGGYIRAQNGLEALQLGGAASPKTEIICGIDFSVMQKLEWIRDKNIELIAKRKEIAATLNVNSRDNSKLKEIYKQLDLSISLLSANARCLIDKLHVNEQAEVRVYGMVYPGVYIEICNVSYVVVRQMRNVTFKLDKIKGKIVASGNIVA